MTKPPKEGPAFEPMQQFIVRPIPDTLVGREDERSQETDARRALRERMEAARAAARTPEATGEGTALVAVLDDAAKRAEALGPAPILLAECPHKYNDAWYDDLWHAVQAGQTWWEQSQFFEEIAPLRVEERAQFEPDADAAMLRAAGAELPAERVAALRAVLRGLQEADWRAAVDAAVSPSRDLLALVVEHGQRWLVLETPNAHHAAIFAWDEGGLFRVGTTGRIDQAVGRERLLTFETVERDVLSRLAAGARRYFLPTVVDSDAVMALGAGLREAVRTVRETTDVPVTLASRDSRASALDEPGWQPPQSYADGLRRGEGELRVPRDGVWPPYRARGGLGEESPLSDLAKGLHTALAPLEDASWRDLFGAAHGETLTRGQTLALLVSADRAVLMRDNAAFRIADHGLEPIGVYPYPVLHKPADLGALAD